eukprot:jgi/Psemu1/4602/gm1.4602_g
MQTHHWPALIASSEYSSNGNTNHKTDGNKGGGNEDEDDYDDYTTGTISTLPSTTTTSSSNNNSSRGTRDNGAKGDTDNNNNNTDVDTMGNSNIIVTQTQTTQDFEVGDGGASDGEGSLANMFLMEGNNRDNDNMGTDTDTDTDNDDKGAPVEDTTVSFPKAPKDFTPPAAKLALGAPPWSAFDWKKDGKYLYHQLPSGCTPVPGKGTKRKCNNWDFYYVGWIPEDDEPAYSRRHVLQSMMNSELLFPSERKGLLNMRNVRSSSCMMSYSSISCLAPPSSHMDPVDEAEESSSKRRLFYSKISRRSSNYANHDHTWKGHYVGRITLKDVFRFDGLLFLRNALYSHQVAQTMSWYHWHQIEANLKLNCNLEARVQMPECKQDMSTFNCAYKFDYIYEALVHNTWYFTEKAGDDLCMDESSWPYYGFGRPMVDSLQNSMFSRGGHTVILSDVDRLCKCPPHLTVDNFFNGNSILDWMGEHGLGMIGTVARNKIPKGVPHNYFHKENASHSARKFACIAQMCNPVTLAKEVPAKAEAGKLTKAYHRLIHKSFFLHSKERGRCNNDKRFWAIEMNHTCELYLRTYGKLHQIDSSISRANIGHKSWKYYHSAVNHAKALSIATAYGIYKELTDVLRQKLAEQMLHYDPKNNLYPAAELLCENTQMSKHQRSRADRRQCCSYTTDHSLVLNYHSLGTVFKSKGTLLHSKKQVALCEALLCLWKPYYNVCSKCKDSKFFGLLKGDVKHRADSKIRSKRNWNPWNVREFLLNEEYMEYWVFGEKKKKEGEGAKEQGSINITELRAALISAVATV